MGLLTDVLGPAKNVAQQGVAAAQSAPENSIYGAGTPTYNLPGYGAYPGGGFNPSVPAQQNTGLHRFLGPGKLWTGDYTGYPGYGQMDMSQFQGDFSGGLLNDTNVGLHQPQTPAEPTDPTTPQNSGGPVRIQGGQLVNGTLPEGVTVNPNTGRLMKDGSIYHTAHSPDILYWSPHLGQWSQNWADTFIDVG